MPGPIEELGDNCATIVKYGGQVSPYKFWYCSFGYCTHACTQASDGTDLDSTATCDGTSESEK